MDNAATKFRGHRGRDGSGHREASGEGSRERALRLENMTVEELKGAFEARIVRQVALSGEGGVEGLQKTLFQEGGQDGNGPSSFFHLSS